MGDAQDLAEAFDEEFQGEDEPQVEPEVDDGYVHGVIGAPDQLGADRIKALVAVEFPADGPLAPEEAALHLEDH
jgi:hypothetical protein